MRKNKIQFQKGMSLEDFTKRYGTKEQCELELSALRWPDGFECSCGCKKYCTLATKHYQCNNCNKKTSVTSGTIFHSTNLPLTKWFLAIYLMTQSKNGISQLELARQVGVSSNTGATMYHKIAQVMMEREDEKPLSGDIEIDDAYWGGKKKGKRGRGSENKVPFIAAVEKIDKKPTRIKLSVVSRFSKKEIEKFAAQNLQEGSSVLSDGLKCFIAVKDAGCSHTALIVGDSKKSSNVNAFNWVNIILGNLKTALAGTFHKLGLNQLKRHLATFVYRFNRRHKLGDMMKRFLYVAARTVPINNGLLMKTQNNW